MSRVTVGSHMAALPLSIQRDERLSSAHRLMREHRIRHLPVMQGRRLVGIVSDRDLHLVETLRDVDPRVARVDEAMTPEPFTVGPRASLERVVRRMAERKHGSAVVVERGRVVEIFTTTDALDALAALLQPRQRGRVPARRRSFR